MESSIFRKSALERISSPEQLNEYMKVAGPGVWCILAGLAATFAAFFIWGITGSIPDTAEIRGTAFSPFEDAPLAIYCFLPIDETKQIEEGMAVRVSPDYAPREQYGYIYGTVRSVGKSPVTAEQLEYAYGDGLAMLSVPSGNVIEVVVSLETRDGAPRWSTSRGGSVTLTPGSNCALTVITAERKPYELMFR